MMGRGRQRQMPFQLREFLGREESFAIFGGHVYGRIGEMFLGLGIVEGIRKYFTWKWVIINNIILCFSLL
jgi:hypothetical protein